MPKNILVFSDGTGQAGGIRPEQRLSNIYKLYRATRIDPTNSIDPAEQVAFYDAGLGTDEDVGGTWLKFVRSVRKILGSATGRGISHNIADCYSFIVDHWEPGDRIWLFGFSRGAYTARCVANVISLCGVPTLDGAGTPLQRFSYRARQIADAAVTRVYEHGAGHPLADFEDERDELAQRFRVKYGSDAIGLPNADPYFIGVFDTVAALGTKGGRRAGLWIVIGLTLFAVCAALALAGSIIFALPWLMSTLVLFASAFVAFAAKLWLNARRSISDYPAKGESRSHSISWKADNYDRKLSRRVRYARHAIAIDETRADFDRVRWGRNSVVREKESETDEPLIQLWFAGNHSDIGGSYPEPESRLSDIALTWMIEQATSPDIPHYLLVDRSSLKLFPSSAGMQHCEIDGFANAHPRLSQWFKWKKLIRKAVLGATLHPSVLDRFALPSVSQCGRNAPYRPAALREDDRVKGYYDQTTLPAEPAPLPSETKS